MSGAEHDRVPHDRVPNHRVTVVLGTRPEIIKLAPVIKRLGERATVVHTGQHFDDAMSRTILDNLGIGEPAHHLGVGGLSRGAQIARATEQIEQLLLEQPSQVVLVQGDTNATLAGALAANAAGVPLVHLEAGMRSFDRSMPEEHNRVLTDALSDLCLVPIAANGAQLEREGVSPDRIRVVGSTLGEAAQALMPTPDARAILLDSLGLSPNGFIVATIHRVENVDDRGRLAAALEALGGLDMPVVMPLHPRTRARIASFELGHLLDRIRCIEPQSYPDFLGLMASCALMISDSGGVQEESTIVRRPVLIARTSTERSELLGTFAHLVTFDDDQTTGLIGVAQRIVEDLNGVHRRLSTTETPYAGSASASTVAAIDRLAAAHFA